MISWSCYHSYNRPRIGRKYGEVRNRYVRNGCGVTGVVEFQVRGRIMKLCVLILGTLQVLKIWRRIDFGNSLAMMTTKELEPRESASALRNIKEDLSGSSFVYSVDLRYVLAIYC